MGLAGGWMALYLSRAGFGFLSRAVHCNAGWPELRVLFSGDWGWNAACRVKPKYVACIY